MRRVDLVGSRADGTASPKSDFDIVVQVELGIKDRPWTPDIELQEKKRLRKALGPLPFPLDLSVRNTDNYAERFKIVGTTEWLVAHRGASLYSACGTRPPIVRMRPSEVVRACTAGWLRDAVAAANGAVDKHNRAVLREDLSHADSSGSPAFKAVRCALNSIFVYHQVLSFKRESIREVLSKIAPLEPALHRRVAAQLQDESPSISVARSVCLDVATVVHSYPDMSARITPIRDLLRRPRMLITLG